VKAAKSLSPSSAETIEPRKRRSAAGWSGTRAIASRGESLAAALGAADAGSVW
jgi:hypothetical protein